MRFKKYFYLLNKYKEEINIYLEEFNKDNNIVIKNKIRDILKNVDKNLKYRLDDRLKMFIHEISDEIGESDFRKLLTLINIEINTLKQFVDASENEGAFLDLRMPDFNKQDLDIKSIYDKKAEFDKEIGVFLYLMLSNKLFLKNGITLKYQGNDIVFDWDMLKFAFDNEVCENYDFILYGLAFYKIPDFIHKCISIGDEFLDIKNKHKELEIEGYDDKIYKAIDDRIKHEIDNLIEKVDIRNQLSDDDKEDSKNNILKGIKHYIRLKNKSPEINIEAILKIPSNIKSRMNIEDLELIRKLKLEQDKPISKSDIKFLEKRLQLIIRSIEDQRGS